MGTHRKLQAGGEVEAWLRRQVAALLNVDPALIDPDTPFAQHGLTSVDGAILSGDLEDWLGIELPPSIAWEYPTIAALAAYLEGNQQSGDTPRGRVVAADGVANPDELLSYGQKALWYLNQLAPASSAYHIAQAARLAIPIDPVAFQRAFQRLVDRHPSLRANFISDGGAPRRVVNQQVSVDFEHVRIAGDDAAELCRRVHAEAERPFVLENDRLFRARLYACDTANVLLIVVHHIVADFWSMSVLVSELLALYQGEASGVPAALDEVGEVGASYSEFIAWQEEMLASDRGAANWEYWREALAGSLPMIELPADRPRAAVQRFRGSSSTTFLAPSQARSIRRLAERYGASPFAVALTAFYVLLYRLSGQDDLIVGCPTAGRHKRSWSKVVGYFVNPVALRARLAGNPTFGSLLKQVFGTILGALDHQEYPFPLLVERLRPLRDPSRSPFFQVMFSWQNTSVAYDKRFVPFALSRGTASLTAGPLRVEAFPLVLSSAQFDLALEMGEVGDEIAALWRYDTDLFDEATIARFAANLSTLVDAIAANPEQPIETLDILAPAERARIVVEWNATAKAYTPASTLHDLVSAAAAQHPSAPAVLFGDSRLTYAELDRTSNQLAHLLRASGVEPGSMVAVCMRRSLAMPVALIAILKAGASFVPIDPDWPLERKALVLEETGRPVVVGEGADPALPAGTLLVDVARRSAEIAAQADTAVESGVGVDDLAYVLYTSGSTGRPKGVLIPHRGIVNRMRWIQDYLRLAPGERVVQKTPLTFDVSIGEIFWPLIAGGELVVARHSGHTDMGYLVALLSQERVSVAHFVPSVLRAFLAALGDRDLPCLRDVICSGEVLPVDLQEQFRQQSSAGLHNLYGPTEASIDVTYWRCDRDVGLRVPIGRPMANTQIYILDRHLQPVPVGVAGELHIAGTGLARGYLGRDDLTAERFVISPLPENPSARLYKTGDIARYRPDGAIEFIGRNDNQIKRHGVRLEPAEIEAALSEHPQVDAVVVMAEGRPAGDCHLVAYVACRASDGVDSIELRRFLAGKLPLSSIPDRFVTLRSLPLTGNGKIDGDALRQLGADRSGAKAVEPPLFESALERSIAQAFAVVLGVETVGPRDDFFELGGDSLSAAVLAAHLSAFLGFEIELARFLLHPSPASLAVELSGAGSTKPVTEASGAEAGGGQSAFPDLIVERRSLIAMRAAGALDSVEAAALAALPVALAGDHREVARQRWCGGLPSFQGVLAGELGRLAIVVLPIFEDEVYRHRQHLADLVAQGCRMASSLGARFTALTGLLASATDYGRGAATSGGGALTTGHATTAAAVVLNLAEMWRRAGRDSNGETVGFLGLGSIGQAALRLMLSRLAHPHTIILCDVFDRRALLDELAAQVVGESRFKGRVEIAVSRGGVPAELYPATTIVGATNVARVLDVALLRPGTLMVDDSAPYCFDAAAARARLHEHGDILFADAGQVRSPRPFELLVGAPPGATDETIAGIVRRLRGADSGRITGCMLSALLCARYADLPLTAGWPTLEQCLAHLEKLEALGFRAADPHCDGHAIPDAHMRGFRQRFGLSERLAIET